MSGLKKSQRTKVYDHNTLVTQDDDGSNEPTFQANDCSEGEFLDAMIGEGDDDATLVADFEPAAAELLQEDVELASAYSAYQDARRRLSEKFRRGFWPTSRGSSDSKGKGYGGGFKSGGKGKKGGGFVADPYKNEFLPPTARHVEDVGTGKLNVLTKETSTASQAPSAGSNPNHADDHLDHGQ